MHACLENDYLDDGFNGWYRSSLSSQENCGCLLSKKKTNS